jgi:hypothetical protein
VFGRPRHSPVGRRPARADVSPGSRSVRRNEPISSFRRVTYNRSTSVTSRGGTWPGPDFFPGLRKLAGVPMRASLSSLPARRNRPGFAERRILEPRRTRPPHRCSIPWRVPGRARAPHFGSLAPAVASDPRPVSRYRSGGRALSYRDRLARNARSHAVASIVGRQRQRHRLPPPCLCGGRSQGAWRRNSHGASLMRAIR